MGHQRGDFPEAERQSDRVLSLPMFAELSEEQLERVTAAIRSLKL
jgi:dTDP-4-amino-4,6-dideoxygalactose transaminase